MLYYQCIPVDLFLNLRDSLYSHFLTGFYIAPRLYYIDRKYGESMFIITWSGAVCVLYTKTGLSRVGHDWSSDWLNRHYAVAMAVLASSMLLGAFYTHHEFTR